MLYSPDWKALLVLVGTAQSPSQCTIDNILLALPCHVLSSGRSVKKMEPYLIHGTHWGLMARYRDTKYSSDYEKACNIIRFTCLFHVLLILFTSFLFYVGGGGANCMSSWSLMLLFCSYLCKSIVGLLKCTVHWGY